MGRVGFRHKMETHLELAALLVQALEHSNLVVDQVEVETPAEEPVQLGEGADHRLARF